MVSFKTPINVIRAIWIYRLSQDWSTPMTMGVEALYTKEYHYAYMLKFKGKGHLTWQDQGPITYAYPIYHMR